MRRSSPMSEHRDTLERELDRLSPPRIPLDLLTRRRDRKRRDQRIRAGLLGLAIAIAVGWLGINAIRSTAPVPAGEPTPTPALPALRRGAEFLVFERLGTGQGWDLAARDPQTGEVRKIVETDGIVDCAAGEPCSTFIKEAEWSSDGRWVAFEVTSTSLDGAPLGPCGPTVGVWVQSAEGEPRQLTAPGDGSPTGSDVGVDEMWEWSPVGTRLAYARVDGTTDELFVIDLPERSQGSRATGNIARASIPALPAWALEWSPDGTRIAY